MFKLPKMTGEEFTVFAMVQDAADGSKDYPARTLAGYIQRVAAALAAENSRLSESTVDPECPLYPSLSEAGKNAAEAIIANFKNNLAKVAGEAIADLYGDIADYIESDSWTNYRNNLMKGLLDYRHGKDFARFDFEKIRAKIFADNRAEIIKDIEADIVKENEELKEQIERLHACNRARFG